MTTMRIVRDWQPCEGCKKPGKTDEMVETATVGVSASNEWWHDDCLENALDQHPEWEDCMEFPCTACGGDGIDDDVMPCPACDGEGRTD